MAKYTNPSPKPYALPPERARQAARTHQAMDDIELSTGPWLEIGRRYPSETWPIIPVSKVSYPGLRRAGRRLRHSRQLIGERPLHVINGVLAFVTAFVAVGMMTHYGDLEPPNAWALTGWLAVAFGGLPLQLFLAVRHLHKGL